MFDLLKGVRVVECAVLMNGGSVGMLLGDLGADVIKLETPGRGDYLRDFLGQVRPHWSPAHLQMNKNKRSLALDVSRPEGRELFAELLKTVDVFVDGFTVGALDRLGIGYAAQKALKPDIVYLQYTGYGASGPYAGIPTHGYQMNALVGGRPAEMGTDGLVHPLHGRAYMGGTESAAPGPSAGSSYAALAAVAALQRRNRSGQGAYIDVAAADAVLTSSWVGATYNFNYERIESFVGLNRRDAPFIEDEGGGSARYQLYETQDRRILLFCAIEPKFWKNFCRAVGREDLVQTLSEAAPVDFGLSETALRRELQQIFHTRTLAEWTALAAERDIAMGPAHRIEEVPDDPQVRSRGVIVDGAHPQAGAFTYIGYPAVIDGRRYGEPRPAPALAEHTAELLSELGVDAQAVQRLRSDGVIG